MPLLTKPQGMSYMKWLYQTRKQDSRGMIYIPAGSYIQGTSPGSPVGVITPQALGVLWIESSTPSVWQANGLTNTSWQAVGGGSGSITTIQNLDGSLTIVDGTGPTVTISVTTPTINQLTGDVVAGPGGGSQVAALQNSANVKSIIAGNVPLTTAAGTIGSSFTITLGNTTYTWMTTASLSVGIWLVTVSAAFYNPNTMQMSTVVGTATATFAGPIGTIATAGGFDYGATSYTFIATVTVAGTLLLQTQSSGTGASVLATNSTAGGSALSSGYTALLLAS